jgi:hypothetical protein
MSKIFHSKRYRTKKKGKFALTLNNFKISAYMGISRRSLYDSKYIKVEKNDNTSLCVLVKRIYEDNKENYGRPKILHLLNKILVSSGKEQITDWQLYKLMKQLNIKANLMSKNGRKDPKNPSFKAQNLIKRK